MIFTSLASSSAGNAYLVTDEKTKILVECGLPKSQLQKKFKLSELAACLVTHEHKDHSKSALELISDGVKVYMSYGTAEALEANFAHILEPMKQVNIGTFDIVPFATFHDAAEPLGFLIKSRVDGDILAFATDTVNLRYKFPGLNILAIEANHDSSILEKCTKMPEKVRKRISNTHMEIDTLCDYLKTLELDSCREIFLLHLSDASSNEEKFVTNVMKIVPKSIKVSACRKK
jgi:phosphoribosyl 1,2-cyclic phosphodiesterase